MALILKGGITSVFDKKIDSNLKISNALSHADGQ